MKLKKILSVMLVSVLAAMAFAYDGSVQGNSLGSYTEREFDAECSDMDSVYQVLQSIVGGATITNFFNVNDSTGDAEDAELTDDLVDFIKRNYKVRNKDAYAHIVYRGETVDGSNGYWFVLSHFISNKWGHYIYYFEVQ